MQIRLQKAIADAGYCSRRKAEELISLGKVKINNEIIKKLGTKVDIEKDIISIGGKKLETKQNDKPIYIMLNKPAGYITSTSSKQGKSVLNLLKPKNYISTSSKAEPALSLDKRRIYPVGRLDKDSEGLVLLTNDGELANQLTHPRNEHEKEYKVEIDRRLSTEDKRKLEKPMKIGREKVRGLKIIDIKSKGKHRVVKLVLKEGKNRQIRRMFGKFGYKVVSLKRTRINKLNLASLPKGKWQEIKKNNII